MPIDQQPQVRSGDLLHLTRAASPQFARPIIVRVIRALTDRHTYHGWLWIDAYGRSSTCDVNGSITSALSGGQWGRRLWT
ncbi:hypothetical protein OOJ91_06895 [Micromonospora lupini]|uniref:hypothetical protein n=1 Tax=Micromonospora lupini TaxID=285679 RepID=UPI002252D5DD|nr:hypothetical protein [Micromonospora lupini]MCX5065607.1 hypothetical protein [Micromonospora lupini]